MFRTIDLGKNPGVRQRLVDKSRPSLNVVIPKVRRIIEMVRREGDAALLELTKKYDRVMLKRGEIRVSKDEIESSYDEIDPGVLSAIREAAEIIRHYHSKQLPKEWNTEVVPGVRAGQILRPLDRVGIYIPGGLARYPSTALHTIVPAKVAGVEHIVVCTPPSRDGRIDPVTLVAIDIAGGGEVYRVGGPQAIAAMAWGTETIPRVDKIVGPGNVYVTVAKLLVSVRVGIDFPAGPTELVILADSSADPAWVAWDMVAQAEHDPNATVILLTPSRKLAFRVLERINGILKELPKAKAVRTAIHRHGGFVVTKSLADAIKFVNEYAPEHLQLMIRNPREVLRYVRSAGTILLGRWSPPAAGDFAVGPSHVLPTGGVARWRGGLTVLDFLKFLSIQELSRNGLRRIAPIAEKIAEAEGLHAHAWSVRREVLSATPVKGTRRGP